MTVSIYSEKHDLIDHEVVLKVTNDDLTDTLKSWDFNLFDIKEGAPQNVKYQVQEFESIPIYKYDTSKITCDPKLIGTYDLNKDLEYYCYNDDKKIDALYQCQSDKECFREKTNSVIERYQSVPVWVTLKQQNTLTKAGKNQVFALDPYLFEKQKQTLVRVTWKTPLGGKVFGSSGSWAMNPSNWWNSTWLYARDINVFSPVDQNTYKWSKMRINLDSSALVSAGKLQADCNDFRIIQRDTNSLDLNISGCNTTDTNIYFAIPHRQKAGQWDDTNLTLYYGNTTAYQYPHDRMFVESFFDDFDDGVIQSDWNLYGAWVESTGYITNTGASGRSINWVGRQFELPSDGTRLVMSVDSESVVTNNASIGFFDNANSVAPGSNGYMHEFGNLLGLQGIKADNGTKTTIIAGGGVQTANVKIDYNSEKLVIGYDSLDDGVSQTLDYIDLSSNWTVASIQDLTHGMVLTYPFMANTDKIQTKWFEILVGYIHKSTISLEAEQQNFFTTTFPGFNNVDYNFKGIIKVDFNVWGHKAGAKNTGDYNFSLFYSTIKNQKGNQLVLDSNLAANGNCSDANAETYPMCYYSWDSSAVKDLNGVYFALDLNTPTYSNTIYSTQPFRIDNNAPTIDLFGATIDDWNSEIITATLVTDDNGTGVLNTQYRLDTNAESGINFGSWTNYVGAITLPSNDGNYVLDVNSWDLNSNWFDKNFILLQDMNTPVITSSYPCTNLSGTNATFTFLFYVNDWNGSGDNNVANLIVKNADTNAVLSDSNISCIEKVCSLLVAFAVGDTKYVQAYAYDRFYRKSTDFNSGEFERTAGGVPVVPPGGGGSNPPIILPNFVTPSLVTISASTNTLSLPPGSTRVYTIIITNLTSQQLPFEATLHDGLELYLTPNFVTDPLNPGETRFLLWNATVPKDENYSFFTGYVQFNLNNKQEYVKQELSLSPVPVFDLQSLFSLQLFGLPFIVVLGIIIVVIVIVWGSFKK